MLGFEHPADGFLRALLEFADWRRHGGPEPSIGLTPISSIFNRVAERAKCRMEVFTTNPLEGAFRNKVTELLWQGLGDREPLPEDSRW